MNIKDAVSIANNIVNPADADKLKAYIYDLQKENLELKSQLEDCKTKLKVFDEWNNTKSLYQEHKTEHGSVVYVRSIKEDITDIFYCPVCFSQKSIIPLQNFIKQRPGLKVSREHIKECPSCQQIFAI